MPIPQSSADLHALQRLGATSPLLWLYEIEIPSDPPTRYRFVANSPASVTFRGNVYSPFPITHQPTQRGTEGNLPTTTLAVSNVTREISAVLDTYDGLSDQPVRIMLVNSATLESGKPIAQEEFTIEACDYNEETVSIRLAPFNMYQRTFPALLLKRGHCRWAYRSPECGYAVPEAQGGLPTCSKSLGGPNGCEAHGDNEVAASQERKHPERFGGAPGIPRQPTKPGL